LTQTTRYASILAKIGAQRSRLLDQTKLNTLIETRNLQGFVLQLRDTPYQQQIASIPPPLTSRKLERAFRKNLIEAIVKIIKYSPRRALTYLCLYLLRFEVENLKALIKATNANLSVEQKMDKTYLLAEDYLKKRAVIEEVAKAQNFKQIVAVMKGSDYALALSMGLQSFEEDGSTACIDVLLDKVYFEKLYEAYMGLAKNEKPHAYFYASMSNDSFTLLTLLRGKALKYDPDWLRLAVPSKNFKLGRKTVEAIVTAVDFETALKIAFETSYARWIVKSASPQETVAKSEKAFKNAMLVYAKESRIRENFDIGAPLAFLTQKEVEVQYLTAIGLGVESGTKPEDLQN
jgi:vacuolar-type H+-ATPase subunit C/Vma6